LWLISLQRGSTEDYLEREDFNDRDLLESCPTTACEASGNSSCIGQNYSSCTDVLCVDACGNSYFYDSDVVCEYDAACATALFENSQVVCNETKACSEATFINSVVECHLSVDDNSEFSCDDAIWFHCNCCLNYWDWGSCPPEIPPCFDDTESTLSFCKRRFLAGHVRIGETQSVKILLSNPFHPSIQRMNAPLTKILSSADSMKAASMNHYFLRVL
jgi:hypothetical protein